MGFGTWGTVALKALINADYKIPLVITHPQSNHPYEQIWNDSVAKLAQENRIPIIERKYANDTDIEKLLEEIEPTIILSSNWRTWLSPKILSIPKLGGINIHDAPLPRYAGFAPINWAIINGENRTGVTAHMMAEDFDTGDIICQKFVAIDTNETATDIFYKTLPLFGELALESVSKLISGNVKLIKQDLSQKTFFHKRSIADSKINWNLSRETIHNLVKAQSDPYPNAFTYYNSALVKIKSTELTDEFYGGTPGRVFSVLEEGVVVTCGNVYGKSNQGLLIKKLELQDGKLINANQFINKAGTYIGGE